MKSIVMYSLLALGGLLPTARHGLSSERVAASASAPAVTHGLLPSDISASTALRGDLPQSVSIAAENIDTVALACADVAALRAEQVLSKLFGSDPLPVAIVVGESDSSDSTAEDALAVPPVWIACGTAISFVSPPQFGWGSGATPQAAAYNAALDAMKSMLTASGARCTPCWIPSLCQPTVAVLPGGWQVIGIVPSPAGGWDALVKYTGGFSVYCSVCPSDPV